MKRIRSNSNQSNIVWWAIAAIYAAIFSLILVLAYSGKLPAILMQNDKPAHLILYCLATYVGHRALNRRRLRLAYLKLPLFPLLFAIFTTVEEGLQAFSPNRSMDAIDLAASLAGVTLGYWLAERGKQP